MQPWYAYATDCEQNCSGQYYDFIDFCHDSANRNQLGLTEIDD